MNWKIKSIQEQSETVDEIVQRLLSARGIATDEQSISNFLEPGDLSLGYLLASTGITKGSLDRSVKLVKDSMKAGRPIIVYGDYDVDGVCATAILWQALHRLKAVALPFIPLRLEHGYGLSEKGITAALKLFPGELPLIITVDNGITGAALIAKYESQGIDFLVADHHLVPRSAPKPKHLLHSTAVCGTVISFLFSFALSGTRPPLDLPALATVCDQLPLLGINRHLVKAGLEEIRAPQRLGLKTLMTEAGIVDFDKIDTYHLGFIIGPRLNAAGRLGHALDALRLLCTGNEKQAQQLALELKKLNENRQELTQSGIDLALTTIAAKATLPKVLLVSSPDFHEGIIGLIAARLAERFHRPAIAISTGEETSKASARSVPGVDIVALLRQVDHLLLELGGHEGAAGFTLTTAQIPFLETALETLDDEALASHSSFAPEVDLLLHSDQDLAIVNRALARLSPFGTGFPVPVLALTPLTLYSHKIVGATAAHLQLQMKNSHGQIIKGICFNKAKEYNLALGSSLSVAFFLQENAFMGATSLQLNVQQIEPTV